MPLAIADSARNIFFASFFVFFLSSQETTQQPLLVPFKKYLEIAARLPSFSLQQARIPTAAETHRSNASLIASSQGGSRNSSSAAEICGILALITGRKIAGSFVVVKHN